MRKKILLLMISIFSMVVFGESGEKVSYKGIEFHKKGSPEGEFRGVWIATVLNINWPSKIGFSAEQQQNEFKEILNEVKEMNMNAVIVQVRPEGDSFYPSQYSPWSRYLTGTQGKSPGYDPLKFMVEESHKRGIEFHAWFNPYRIAMNDSEFNTLSPDNFAIRNPDAVIKYRGKYYLNPGIPEVKVYVIKSMMEVVNNYDIDAVHIDDYFYPYTTKGIEFPDNAVYEKYRSGFESIEDWRRGNINSFIQELHRELKTGSKDMKLGISPFGVWRNISDDVKGSETKASSTSYDNLYADTLYWIDRGWVDYVIPQIYWNFGFSPAPYESLVKWWINSTKEKGVNLYIGHGAYKLGQDNWDSAEELINQIYYNRDLGVRGSAFFSIKSILNNDYNIKEILRDKVYRESEK